MNHKIHIYIAQKTQEFNWKDNQLAMKSGISPGQISKLKNENITKLYAQTFYNIVKAFDDNFENAIKIVFNIKEIKLKKYIPKKRNSFGNIMKEYEKENNVIDEISAKTGIELIRLNELYFRNGSLEAYELLLIEKAIGLKYGILFEKIFRK